VCNASDVKSSLFVSAPRRKRNECLLNLFGHEAVLALKYIALRIFWNL
jgi:hypothetical protein